MRPHPSSIVLLLLAALALGYLVGTTRSGTAEASPVPFQGTGGTYLTHDANDNVLTIWSFRDGRPTHATEFVKVGKGEGNHLEMRVLPLEAGKPDAPVGGK